jgi:hypothetical protein
VCIEKEMGVIGVWGYKLERDGIQLREQIELVPCFPTGRFSPFRELLALVLLL